MSFRAFLALVASALLIAVVLSVMLPLGALGASQHCGIASWYGNEHHGRRTASGAIFDQYALTAAMPDRARLGERWRVTYRGKSVVVTITDLGPHKRLGRIIDLSRGAAAKIGMIEAGVGRVCVVRVG
jgi:rare lipoprotein A